MLQLVFSSVCVIIIILFLAFPHILKKHYRKEKKFNKI